jgi:acetyl-CoA carboxylase alpha subunit
MLWLCVLQLRKETYSRLTPTQRLQVARHPNRPTCLDIILNITDKFVELHGDRAGLDDPAIVCGIGSMDGVSFMFIGHQKGRNTKVRAAAPYAAVHSSSHPFDFSLFICQLLQRAL